MDTENIPYAVLVSYRNPDELARALDEARASGSSDDWDAAVASGMKEISTRKEVSLNLTFDPGGMSLETSEVTLLVSEEPIGPVEAHVRIGSFGKMRMPIDRYLLLGDSVNISTGSSSPEGAQWEIMS